MGAEGLDYQNVAVDFTSGMDTRSNPKLRVQGKWDSLLNCTHSTDGTPTKRDGHVALDGLNGGHGLALHADELLTIDGQVLRSVAIGPLVGTQPGQVGDAVLVKSVLPNVSVAKRTVAAPDGFRLEPDCAFGGSAGKGQVAYVWSQLTTAMVRTAIHLLVLDAETGATVLDEDVVASSSAAYPRVVWSHDAFVVLWTDAGGVYGRCFVPGLSTALGPVAGLIAVAAAKPFDACSFHDAVAFSVSISALTGVGGVCASCGRISRSGTSLSLSAFTTLYSTAQLPYADVKSICTVVASASYCCTFVSSNGVSAFWGTSGVAIDTTWAVAVAPRQFDLTRTATTAPNHIVAVGSGYDTGVAVYTDGASEWNSPLGNLASVYGILVPIRVFFTSILAGAWQSPTVATLCNSALLPSNSCQGVLGPFIAGKPFITGSVPWVQNLQGAVSLPVVMLENIYTQIGFVPAASSFLSQSSAFVIDGSVAGQGCVVGKAMYGSVSPGFSGLVAPYYPVNVCTAPSTMDVGLGVFAVPVLESGPTNSIMGINQSTCGLAVLRMSANQLAPVSSAQIGRSTFFANGMLSRYDGRTVEEAVFNLFPDGMMVLLSHGGVATWPVGKYQAVVIYESVDDAGQTYQSAPSYATPFEIVAGGDKPIFEIPSLLLIDRHSGLGGVPRLVQQVIYCTRAGGTAFYRLTDTVLTPPIYNSTSSATSSTLVTYAPSDGAPLLYHQPSQAGTTLPNLAPSPCDAVGVHQGRLFANALDREGWWAYSQVSIEGIGLQWSDALCGRLPSDSGKITGFASIDDKLIILSANRIYVVTGSGPSPSGDSNGFSDAVVIPSDVGCSDPFSVTSLPIGVMFRSSKGWYLVERDLSVKYIGGPVKRFDRDSVTGIVVLGDRQEVRISSNASAYRPSAGGYQLVYSYQSSAWSYFSIRSDSDPYHDFLQVTASIWWPYIGRWCTLSFRDGLNYDAPGLDSKVDQVGLNAVAYPVAMSLTTAFMAPAGLESYMRIRWLYLTMASDNTPDSSLILSIMFDDDYLSGYAFAAVDFSTLTLASLKAIDFRHKLRRQKCKSLAITITESIQVGSIGINSLQALALQIGKKRGTNKLPAAYGVG